MESQIEKVINQITSSDLFLRGVATVINFNSYRKIIIQNLLEKVLKELELPVRRDQERLLALVQELEIRIKKMQLNEENITAEQEPIAKMVKVPRQKALKNRKTSSVKRMN